MLRSWTANDRARVSQPLRIDELEGRFAPAAPIALSINRELAAARLTNAGSVVYTVIFDQPVTGVDASDFFVAAASKAPANIVVTGSGANYSVTVGPITNDGQIRLSLLDNDTIIGVSNGLPLNGAGTAPVFSNAVTYPANATNHHVSVADFNGDLRPDIVVPGKFSASVSAFLGNGDGTFQSALVTPTNQPRRLIPADFDGDGRLDLLAVTPDNGHQISLLLGNGDGRFRPSVLATANEPVTVADFNDDGFQDIAYTESSAIRNIHLMLGNGNGTFRPSKVVATGVSSLIDLNFVVGKDVNADGKLDLIYSASSAAFRVMLGMGDGTFANSTNMSGAVANHADVADVNRDGKLDIVTVAGLDGGSNGTVSVFLGNGNGLFKPLGHMPRAPFPNGCR